MDQHGPNKNNINLNANWNCIRNPNQHGCYNKPSIELVQKTSLVPTPMDLAICFQPSASMDPMLGIHMILHTALQEKIDQETVSHENREYFFHRTSKQKKQYEIQFQLEDYTSYFSTAPHEPTSTHIVQKGKTLCQPYERHNGSAWWLLIPWRYILKPTWRCSQKQMLVCWCYKDRQAVGVENNGYIYILYT